MPNWEEEEDEENGKESQMLGFMFGNVDDAGDLDVEYLDQDAKEHLSALADQLGPSLVDLDLSSTRRAAASSKVTLEEVEDYARKAEDAVDYEDIEEEYEGPEGQLLPQEQEFFANAALSRASKFSDLALEEEDYDEVEEDNYEETDNVENHSQSISEALAEGPTKSLDFVKGFEAEKEEEIEPGQDDLVQDDLDMPVEDGEWHKKEAEKLELPVLCEIDGKEVLRFSELFGVREPYWAIGGRKLRQKRSFLKEKWERPEDDFAEDLEMDEEDVLKTCAAADYRQPDYSEAVLSHVTSEDDADEVEESSCEASHSSLGLHAAEQDWRPQLRSRKTHFVTAEPMKSNSCEWELASRWAQQVAAANFEPIYQQDWELQIVWGDGPSRQDEVPSGDGRKTFSSPDTSGEILRSALSPPSEEMPEETSVSFPVGPAGKENMRPCNSQYKPVLIEPLSKPFRKVPTMHRHPQMLRLEALPTGQMCSDQVKEDSQADGSASDLVERFKELDVKSRFVNTELESCKWLDRVHWGDQRPGDALKKSPIIFDLRDPAMVFEIPDTKEAQGLRSHAAAMVVAPQLKDSVVEEAHTVSLALAQFNISNDKYYTTKKQTQQQKSHTKKRAAHGLKVMHSLPAIKLQTMKPKLTNKDLANFHRPKAIWYPHHNEVAAKEQGKLAVKGPMKVILKTLGGKGSKLQVDASETLETLKAKASKKFGDLKASEKTKVLYCGKELQAGKNFAEQEVPPNSVLHLVRTKVYPWPKAQKIPGENKPTRPPGAFKKKSELSVKDGHLALMEYCEERPLLLSNIGMGARLATYYRKQTATDSTAATLKNERGSWAGVTLPLEPTEDSPFLGDIQPGETQSSLETPLYRAPVFAHKVASTDFLLVRSAKGKLSLRRIDSSHVVGQQEPLVEVFTPSSKAVQNYVGNRLLVYVYREFRANEKPGQPPRIRNDELLSQFPSLSEGFTRKRLKTCADYQKGPGGEMFWTLRKNFRIPSEEELRRLVSPENVCSYESMQAGLHHLKRIGIQKLTQHSGLTAAIAQLPDDAIVIAAASVIERQLQFTPWNLSSNFVAATSQGRQCIERLEITGVGDPSGRGLGFSYLRVASKPPSSGALVEKKAAAARGGGAVTGTDADLRRLSMDAAREVLLKFKVPEAVIERMTRWHRIALVRKLSSEQAASGVKVGVAALNKFARGQRMSFLQLQQQTREKCQEVWDRQAQSLSCGEGEDSESDGEANGDLDSFAGDLENLLEAVEGEDKDDVSKKTKREGMRGLGSRRRAQQAQREEEIEDEEAEAAELRRMLMEDDEAEEDQQKKKSGTGTNEKKVGPQKDSDKLQQLGDHPEGVKKKKQIVRKLKRIIKTLQPDGTYSYKEEMISDPKEIALYLAKKNAAKAAGEGEKSTAKGDKPAKAPVSGKKEKKKPVVKEIKVNKVTKVTKEKVTKDGLRVVCGACGQLGHMRTNKKCPLYMEDADKASKPDAAAGEGLVERQGTKLTIKTKKKADESQTPRSVNLGPPKTKPPAKEKKDIVPEKLPALKIKIPVLLEAGMSSIVNKQETSLPVSTRSENVPDSIADGAHVQGTIVKASIKVAKDPPPKNERVQEHGSQQEVQQEEPRALFKQVAKPKKLKIRTGDGNSQHVKEMPQERREKDKRQRLGGHRDRAHEEDVRQLQEKHEQDTKVQKTKDMFMVREREERARAIEIERLEKEREMELEKERMREREMEKERERELEMERERERERKRQRDREDRARELKERERQRERELQREREIQKEKELQRERDLQKERELQRERDLHREKMRLQEERERQQERQRQERVRLDEGKVRRGQVPNSHASEEERNRGSKKRAHPEKVESQPKRQRKRGGGEVELSNILETVVQLLKKSDVSYLFLKPVSKKDAPDYLVHVKRPMDLASIREKVRGLVYKSRDEFRQDVEQIAVNAHIYNDGRNPGIPPLADKLLEICDEQLELRHYDLEQAESGVERFGEDQCSGVRAPALDRRRGGSRMY